MINNLCISFFFQQSGNTPFDAASPGLGQKVGEIAQQLGALGKKCDTSADATVAAFHECFSNGAKEIQSSVADNKILSAFVGGVMTTDAALVACAEGDASQQESCTVTAVSNEHDHIVQFTSN